MKAGMQERGTERRMEDAKCAGNKKYAMMNAHAHIVKVHMVIGATAKFVHQFVSLGIEE